MSGKVVHVSTGGFSPRELVRKAELELADLQTDGGYMNAEQSKTFIRLLIKESVLLSQVMVHPMKSHTTELDKIKLASRVLKPGTPGTALLPADRVKPDTSKVELVAKLFKGEINLQDEVLEDNIESGNLRQTIMALMTQAIARDVEDVVINGEIGHADPTLAVLDGIRKQVVTNTHDFLAQPLNKDDLSDVVRAMPVEYRKLLKEMRFLTSYNAEQDYRNSLADRGTVVGDRYLLENIPVVYSGIPVEPIPVWPENLGAGNDQTDLVLTPLKNIVYGVWRKIRIEVDRDIREGKFIIVASIRFDTKLIDELATVKGENIQVG